MIIKFKSSSLSRTTKIERAKNNAPVSQQSKAPGLALRQQLLKQSRGTR